MYVDAVSPHSAFAPPCAGPPQGTVECFHRLQTDSRHQGSCPSDFREHEAQQQAPRKHQGAPPGGRQAAGCGPALAASLGAPGALSVSQNHLEAAAFQEDYSVIHEQKGLDAPKTGDNPDQGSSTNASSLGLRGSPAGRTCTMQCLGADHTHRAR